MENKNWLAQTLRDFKDSDFGEEFGIPQSEWSTGQINKIMLDRVHAMNLAGYIACTLSNIILFICPVLHSL
jgi:hypothetical protein